MWNKNIFWLGALVWGTVVPLLGQHPDENQKSKGKDGPNNPSNVQVKTSTGLIPLTELGAEKYKGEDGGLYGGGINEPPSDHLAAALKESEKVCLLDSEGNPSENGKIVVLCLGVSNSGQAFKSFSNLAEHDSDRSPSVVLVNGSQPKPASQWVNDSSEAKAIWEGVDQSLKRKKVTPQQVQVVWVKHVELGPSKIGEFPIHAKALQDHITKILVIAKKRYPNLCLAYLSSRTYGGYARGASNPEPYAYESGFANRWVILDQIKGNPELNYLPEKGDVKAPLVLWGPYFWADGIIPRKSDGLIWEQKDVVEKDGVHEAPSGQEKTGEMLLTFFKTDPTTKTWFLKNGHSVAAVISKEITFKNIDFQDSQKPEETTEKPQDMGNQKEDKKDVPFTSRTSTGLIPLTEIEHDAPRYKGEDAGLYGWAWNEPPEDHLAAALQQTEKIRPLDSQGEISPNGTIVFLAIGMSNTTQEFSYFKTVADQDPQKSSEVIVIDGAQGGKDVNAWADPEAKVWTKVEERLNEAKVTPAQVQVAWFKHGLMDPSRYGEFPAPIKQLQTSWMKSLKIAKKRYPNLQIAYLSSRTYAGYATGNLNPEPYAYESAFVVQRMIRDQINENPDLNYDPIKGGITSPLLLWGPYLWADGIIPRKKDGLIWEEKDFGNDGVHPSQSGRKKVTDLLLKFLKTDPTAKKWFLKK